MDTLVHHVEMSVWNGLQVYVSTIEHPRPSDAPPLSEGELVPAEVRVTPVELFESLAVQYDIDPESPGGWEALFELWAYARSLGETVEDQLADPDFVLNARTGEQARKARLAKIHKHRGTGRLRGVPGKSKRRLILDDAWGVQSSGEEDPLEFIKRTAPMSRPHMRVLAAHFHRQRSRQRALRAGLEASGLGVYEHEEGEAPRRDMRLYRRETPEELARILRGSESVPDVEGVYREPPSFLSGGRAG